MAETSSQAPLGGFGGWLPVVGISIVFGLIGVIANTYTYSQIFSDGTWEALTTPGTDVYNPLWAPVIIGQLIFNSALALAYICLICLCFTKHYLFPKVCIASMAVTLVYIPLRGWVGTFVDLINLCSTPKLQKSLLVLSQVLSFGSHICWFQKESKQLL